MSVIIEWHRAWSFDVSNAFEQLPADELMNVDVVRILFEHGSGRTRQKIGVLRDGCGTVVGVLPLAWRVDWKGLYAWRLLTQYVMPYARFFVLPGYTDLALQSMGGYFACDNVAFYELPENTSVLQEETSWVAPLSCTFDELLRRTRYSSEYRRNQKISSGLELREDQFADLPQALDLWAAKWGQRGHGYTANRRDDLLLGFQVLAVQGLLKTFSLYDGPRFVAMNINMVRAHGLHFMLTVSQDEYRSRNPGIRLVLATFAWACNLGYTEYDMGRTGEGYKKKWAVPEVRGYRLVRGPWGSQLLGNLLEKAGNVMVKAQYKLGRRS
jgi:hypothetical protein